jgi:hypothetical protein
LGRVPGVGIGLDWTETEPEHLLMLLQGRSRGRRRPPRRPSRRRPTRARRSRGASCTSCYCRRHATGEYSRLSRLPAHGSPLSSAARSAPPAAPVAASLPAHLSLAELNGYLAAVHHDYPGGCIDMWLLMDLEQGTWSTVPTPPPSTTLRAPT